VGAHGSQLSTSSSAICRLFLPWATMRSTSTSRSVSGWAMGELLGDSFNSCSSLRAMMLMLQQYFVESKVVQDDSDRLLEELQGRLSIQQVEGTMERIKGLTVDSLLDQT